MKNRILNIMRLRGENLSSLSEKMSMDEKSLMYKIKNYEEFTLCEIEKLILILRITEPEYFFNEKVDYKLTI